MRRPSRRIRATLAVVATCAQVVAIVAAGVTADARGSGPPPTPVGGKPSPFPQELATPSDRTIRPDVLAASALLVDVGSGDVLYRKRASSPRPIGSLTKIMAALVVSERTRPDDRVTVAREAVFAKKDYGSGSVVGLRVGERRTVRDLVYGALLGSANDAARALAIHVAGSEAAFVEIMNERAVELGMAHTRFASATGLDDRGRSTAEDLFALARAALEDPRLAAAFRSRFHDIPAPRGPTRLIQNRNVLLWLYRGATGMKTGFTARAGFCLVASAEREGRGLIALVLGGPTEAFSDAAGLLNYGFDGFSRRALVEQGEELGDVRLIGGSVPVVAGTGLEGLVPIHDLRSVRFRLVADPLATYPPRPGEVIGTYRVSTHGTAIGSVPAVAAEVPVPAAPGDGPWWARAIGAVASAIGAVVGALFG